jgi:hypothetical protein
MEKLSDILGEMTGLAESLENSKNESEKEELRKALKIKLMQFFKNGIKQIIK